jgi:hypothetical protein
MNAQPWMKAVFFVGLFSFACDRSSMRQASRDAGLVGQGTGGVVSMGGQLGVVAGTGGEQAGRDAHAISDAQNAGNDGAADTVAAAPPDGTSPDSTQDAKLCLNRNYSTPVYTPCCPINVYDPSGQMQETACDPAKWFECTPFDGSFCTCWCREGAVRCGC